MTRPLYDPEKGKMRVAGLISGSGKSFVSIIEKQKELEAAGNCNFEVAGLFSDNPNSRAEQIATEAQIPYFINDIKSFYRRKTAPVKDLEIRREFDRETADFLRPLKPDLVAYAGYVWAATEPLIAEFMGINCHPADLRVEKEGRRTYAGANGVADALQAGETRLYSTLHLVSAEIDHGPILLVSEPVEVVNDDSWSFFDKMRHHLRLLNEHSRKLFALAVDEMSRGRFVTAADGGMVYNGQPIPAGWQVG